MKDSINSKDNQTKDELEIMRKNFESLRKKNGWSIEELSEISEINKKILTDIEAGKDFEAFYIIVLCQIYKIKPSKIFSSLFI